MKYSIISLLLLASFISCQERQEEEASYNDFFMSRGEKAKSIKDQNYSTVPGASPTTEEARIQEEQEERKDTVMEGIIPESEEEKPGSEPKVNGASETQYLEHQEDQEERHFDGTN